MALSRAASGISEQTGSLDATEDALLHLPVAAQACGDKKSFSSSSFAGSSPDCPVQWGHGTESPSGCGFPVWSHAPRLELYRPQHRYFLLGEKAVSPQTLQERGKGLAGILIRVEQAQGMEDVREAFRDMMQLLKGEESQSLQIAFIEWLQYVGQNIGIAEYIPKATNLQEFDAMLEENLLKWKARQEAAWKKEWSEEWSEEWKEKYLSEGRQEGRLEGRQEMLLDALEDRFGSLPKPVTAYIESEEDAQELRRLLRSAYRVESLEAFCKQIKVSLA